MSKINYIDANVKIGENKLYPTCRICHDIATHEACSNYYCKPCYKYKQGLIRSNLKYYNDAIKRLGTAQHGTIIQ